MIHDSVESYSGVSGPKSRLHVALVLPNLAGGGAERSLLSVAQGLIERGHEVDFVLLRSRIHYPGEIPGDARLFTVEDRPDERTRRGAGDLPENLIPLAAPARPAHWLAIMMAFGWDLRCFPNARMVRQTRAVAAYIDRERPDCVLPSLPSAKVATLLACGLLASHPPVVPTIRNVVQARHPRHRRRYRYLFDKASHFICVSQGVADGLVSQLGVPRTRVSTVHNPVVTPDLGSRMTEPASHPWMDDGGSPVILSAGRLSEQKDYPTLIKAFAQVAAHRPCRLIILGEGRLRGQLQRLVERLGLADSISLPGWVENPFAFMSRAALFVLSSRYEGLPGVLIQALACACPCVSTDCPTGPGEILQGGRFGTLVPVGDPARLAAAINSVLDRPANGRTLRERAADFSAERAVSAYEHLITSVVRKHACGSSSSSLT